MQVLIPEIHLEVTFDEGEELSTEISAKFQPLRRRGRTRQSGLHPGRMVDRQRSPFALSLWQAV
jgi:L-histidine N-alpha-methyltransferase